MTDPVIDLVTGMPDHFRMPSEFMELAGWITRVGYVRNGYGFIADPQEGEHCIVTVGDPARVGWNGYLADPDRLWFVLRTGMEGSSICLWLDDAGGQHVVHHGSGSGSVLFAVLPSAERVLRLLAVGYSEPCWNEEWAEPPSEDGAALGTYRRWVRERWGILPDRTGIDALGLQDRVDEWVLDSGPADDPFLQWLERPGIAI